MVQEWCAFYLAADGRTHTVLQVMEHTQYKSNKEIRIPIGMCSHAIRMPAKDVLLQYYSFILATYKRETLRNVKNNIRFIHFRDPF